MTIARQLLAAIGLVMSLVATGEAYSSDAVDAMYSPSEIKEDLTQFVQIIRSTHPDLSYSANVPALHKELEIIRDRIIEPMSVRQVWQELSRLNPLLSDAHMGLRYPVKEFDAFEENGGSVFSASVRIEEGGRVYAEHGSAHIPGDAEILSINGVPCREIVSALMPRMRGETETIQRMVMAHSFPAYLWSLYDFRQYKVTFKSQATGIVRSIDLPADQRALAPSKEAPAFRYRLFTDAVAYLDIPTFDIAHHQAFKDFLFESFTEIAAREVNALVIDLRQNKGGAHELSDHLTKYLTEQPVRQASALIARITNGNRELAPHAEIGSVVRIALEEWLQPAINPLRFTGDIVLLVGKKTYSQAIVFSAMFQDFSLGRIAGETTDGWANQTGQVQMFPLKHTGLLVAAPLYIIIRPNGNETKGGVQPDFDHEYGTPVLQVVVEQLLEGHGLK